MWQEQTVVQRMQETVFTDPFLLFNKDTVHHGNLPLWATKAEGAILHQTPGASRNEKL
jgi:hypothetical protein